MFFAVVTDDERDLTCWPVSGTDTSKVIEDIRANTKDAFYTGEFDVVKNDQGRERIVGTPNVAAPEGRGGGGGGRQWVPPDHAGPLIGSAMKMAVDIVLAGPDARNAANVKAVAERLIEAQLELVKKWRAPIKEAFE